MNGIFQVPAVTTEIATPRSLASTAPRKCQVGHQPVSRHRYQAKGLCMASHDAIQRKQLALQQLEWRHQGSLSQHAFKGRALSASLAQGADHGSLQQVVEL